MKKNNEEKKEHHLTLSFFNAKNKASAACIAVFLIAGGLVFIFMAFMGERDLRRDDMKFSYGNVLREAFSPIEDFFTGRDKADKAEQIARARMHSRGVELPDEIVNINDWLDAPAEGSAAYGGSATSGTTAGYSKKAKTEGKRNPGEDLQYRKMEAALGSSSFGGAGGTSKTSAQTSSFSGETVSKSAVNTANGNKTKSSKGRDEKPSVKQTLQEVRQDLSTALTSGSAVTAKTSWGSRFDGSTTSSFSNADKAATGKLASAYGDKGLVKLDGIKSGEIENLKKDGSKSIPEASVPKMDEESAANRASETTSSLKDAFDSVSGSLGNSISDGIKNKQEEKDSDKEKSGKDATTSDTAAEGGMSMASVPNAKNEPPDNIKQVMENTRCSGDYSKILSEKKAITYEDTKVNYTQNDDGSWTVTYEGKYAMVDLTNGGERTKEGTYKDTFHIDAKGEKADLVGIIQDGEVWLEEGEQGVVITPNTNPIAPFK